MESEGTTVIRFMYRNVHFIAGLPVLLVVLLMQGCTTLSTISHTFLAGGHPVGKRNDVPPPSIPGRGEPVSVNYMELRGQAMHQAGATIAQTSVRRGLDQQGDFNVVCPGVPGLDLTDAELDLSSEEGLSDEVTPEDNAIDDFVNARHNGRDTQARSEINASINREGMMKEIINMLGVQYRYGGTNALAGIDCSAFVRSIYSRAIGMRLPRTSGAQYSIGRKVKKDKLLVGDLVFFKTRWRRRAAVSHVGIYVGENLFAHASRKQGVMISSLESRYYTKTYVGARRLVDDILSEAIER